MIDKFGNTYKIEIKKDKDKIVIIKTYLLEEGKTTLKGEYLKLKHNSECKYPKRLSCNYGDGFERCEFMEYDNSINMWVCKF